MANDVLRNQDDNEHQDVRPLSHEEMEGVAAGFLQVPPFHGGPVPLPTLPVIPVPTV